MQTAIIGRKKELRILEEALESDEAEMVAVLGRRRVGKTFLVSKSYENRLIFELSGTQNALLKKQLKNFRDELTAVFNSPVPLAVPEDWLSAFQLLKKYLKTQDLTEKKVIFFDEVPWLAGHKSGFLEALGYFWNSWASRQNLIVVICGSAASWMIRRVVHDKGGLHNRITKRINLQPFTLLETEAFLQSKGVVYDRFQLTQLYMSLGGIPQYLKEVKAGQSAVQNIDRLCFAPEGQLTDEFSKLYSALFSQADRHLEIVRTLSQKWKGMTRLEIIEKIRFDSGGVITGLLEELEQSGFITSYFPFGKKLRDKIYRLTDAYSLFYLHFIEKNNPEEGTWLKLSTSQKVKSWSGYAFENVCLSHVPQLKKALGISGVLSSASTFYKNKTTDLGGAQIDLVLDRNDRTVNLFEMKFYDSIFVPTQDFADDLREKRFVFKTYTATNKHLSWVMVSAFGVKHNQYSLGLVDNVLTLDALFEAT
ncbi:MAG: ATP-binding protein [Saprospiraceae bacterium]|nr:ATP-binding protein [Saprospiraceae bacterium]